MKRLDIKILTVVFSMLAIFALSGCGSSGTSYQGGPVGGEPPAAGNPTLIADAGPDQHIKTGALVTLDASKSHDAEHDPLTYRWTMISKPDDSNAVLSDNTSSHPTFIADKAGDYVFELIANDGTADSAPSRVTVTSTPAHINADPVAHAGPDQHIKTGALVTLDGSGSSDADHHLLTYLWSFQAKPSGSSATLIGATTSHPTFTADVDGAYVIKLIVKDGSVSSKPDTVMVTSAAPHVNTKPVAHAGTDQHIKTGSLTTLDGSGSSDADHDLLTYRWTMTSKPGGSTATLTGATTSHPTFTADVNGIYVLKLIVNDGTTDSAPSIVTVTAATGNSKPVADAGPDQHIKTGDVVTLDGSKCSDADHDPLYYTWSFQSKPAGSTATLSGETTSHPTFTADVDGSYVIVMVVGDDKGGISRSSVTVTATTPNSKPVADTGQDQLNAKIGTEVTLDGSKSSDADHDTLAYSWTIQSLPAHSTVSLSDQDTVHPKFTPDVWGSYVIKLIVNDGTVDSNAATVTVIATPGCGADPSNPSQCVFVTSTLHNGNLGGLGGADQICKEAAASVNLDGTYKAWLSTTQPDGYSCLENANGRLYHSAVPYALTSGDVVAQNWGDLTDGNIAHSINLTERHGVFHAPVNSDDFVWTNTTARGALCSVRGCRGWLSSDAGDIGFTGSTVETDYDWTNAAKATCDIQKRLYCFEQRPPLP